MLFLNKDACHFPNMVLKKKRIPHLVTFDRLITEAEQALTSYEAGAGITVNTLTDIL